MVLEALIMSLMISTFANLSSDIYRINNVSYSHGDILSVLHSNS